MCIPTALDSLLKLVAMHNATWIRTPFGHALRFATIRDHHVIGLVPAVLLASGEPTIGWPVALCVIDAIDVESLTVTINDGPLNKRNTALAARPRLVQRDSLGTVVFVRPVLLGIATTVHPHPEILELEY